MASLTHRVLRWSTLAVAGIACADHSGPSTVSFVVMTATSGPSADTDGYTVQVDANRREILGATDTLLVSELGPGEHQVQLQGVAPNCSVSGGGARTVNTTSGDSVAVRFDVVCSPTAGLIQLVTRTEGVDIDPSGYLARMDDVREVSVGSNAVVGTSLPAGPYQVTLDGIAGNCAVDGPNPRLAEVSSGGVTRLAFSLQCSATTPTGRGQEIAFLRSDDASFGSPRELYVMNEDGTSVRPVLSIPDQTLRAPNWLADGERLGLLAVDLSCEFGFECGTPYILTLGGGAPDPSEAIGDVGTSWSPDGSLIAFEQSCESNCGGDASPTNLVVAAVDGSTRISIASDSLAYTDPAWLADGTGLLYLRKAEGILDFARSDPDGLREVVLSRNLAGEFRLILHLAPSPDGSRIAFSAEMLGQGAATSTQIYLMGMDGSGLVALTAGPSNNSQPSWSPDGQRIAFASDRDVNSQIYVMEAGGANPTRVTDNPAHDAEPAWRP